MPSTPREVSSFVRRSARMTSGQQRAWAKHSRDWVLDVPRADRLTSVADGATVDLAAAFGRRAPLIVEIGPGMGDSLVPMAAARPDADVLAVEVYEPAAARILHLLARDGVANVRVLTADAVSVLKVVLSTGSVSEVWVFFPDPWPKARHHKRRLVDQRFVDLVVDRLAPGGLWWLATDWPDYARQMRPLLDHHPALAEIDPLDLPSRPPTRFARRATEAGREVVELAYRRR